MAAFKHIEQELGHRWTKEVDEQRVPLPQMLDLLNADVSVLPCCPYVVVRTAEPRCRPREW